jgi:hypothetical protein
MEAKLLELVAPNTAGDPMSSRKLLNCRLQGIQERLGKHRVSTPVISRLLKAHDYHLRSNHKKIRAKQDPERNQQFEHIQAQRQHGGRQFYTATLLDEGPYFIWECGDSEAQVLARLQRVASNRVDYQRRYKNLRTEQDRRRLIYRLQHHQAQVFRELEIQWVAIHSRKPV